jgi:hypothetical protein
MGSNHKNNRKLKSIFSKFGKQLFPTKAGVPQGGAASPTITNMTLDSLEKTLKEKFGDKSHHRGISPLKKVDSFMLALQFFPHIHLGSYIPIVFQAPKKAFHCRIVISGKPLTYLNPLLDEQLLNTLCSILTSTV